MVRQRLSFLLIVLLYAPVISAAPVTVEGDLEILVEDHATHARLRHELVTHDERLTLSMPRELPRHFRTGKRVRVRGNRTGREIQVDSTEEVLPLGAAAASSDLETSALTPLNNTTGEHRVLVIMVNFQNDPTNQPYSLETAHDIFFNQTDDFYNENSYGRTSLSGDVMGWFTIPLTNQNCDTNSIATMAKSAAVAAGANLSAYRHHAYIFPTNACTWWGLGTIGGNPSSLWIKGNLAMSVVAHELGHNFGLYHARNYDCGANVICTNPTVADYGDPIDVMGGGRAHFNAFQKARLGWLDAPNAPPILTVMNTGEYLIEPLSTPGAGPKAIRLPYEGSGTIWYYLEVRRPVGFDSYLRTNANLMNGVLFHRGTDNVANSSYLLDMTPATSSWNDPALTIGGSYEDASSHFTVSISTVGNAGARVRITMTGGPQENPCDIDGNGVTVTDVQLMVNQALDVSPCTADINQDGECNIVDLQRVVNVVLGGSCVTTP